MNDIASSILYSILNNQYMKIHNIASSNNYVFYSPEFYPQGWASMNYEVRIGMLKEALEKKKKLTDVQISMEDEEKQHGKQS